MLDAGLAELRESSYANLTMRAVAARAGVSPASAYTYFPSKSALVAAVFAALMADDPAVAPLREQIGHEVSRRIRAALGPGWSRAVKSTLQMTFAGALMTARFVSYPEIAGRLDEAVDLILVPDAQAAVSFRER